MRIKEPQHLFLQRRILHAELFRQSDEPFLHESGRFLEIHKTDCLGKTGKQAAECCLLRLFPLVFLELFLDGLARFRRGSTLAQNA